MTTYTYRVEWDSENLWSYDVTRLTWVKGRNFDARVGRYEWETVNAEIVSAEAGYLSEADAWAVLMAWRRENVPSEEMTRIHGRP